MRAILGRWVSVESRLVAAENDQPGGTRLEPAATGRHTFGPAGSWLWLPVIVYVGLGFLAYWPSWANGASHTLQCGGCGDNGQEVWFLAWGGHALQNLENPLRTNWINFPWGVDLADNTSMPLAGFVGLPITLLFGPIATYNAWLVFAFASSATAAMLAFRRFVRSPVATFVGGLVYGFSPYMVGQGAGHLFVLLAPVPPLMILVVDEILIRQHWHWWLAGLALGGLGLVQLGWSAEVLAEEVLMGVIGLAVLMVTGRRLVRERLPYAARALGLAALLTAPFVALFAYATRTGPEHRLFAAHPISIVSGLATDLASLVVPTSNQRFGFGATHFGSSLVGLLASHGRVVPDLAENGAYVGIPLLLLVLFAVWRHRHDGLVRFAAAMALVALVMSMGSHLTIWHHRTHIPLPFLVLTKLPFLQSEVPIRYTLFMWLFVSLLVARLLTELRPRVASLPQLAMLGAGLLALTPAFPGIYNLGQADIPAWFSSGSATSVPSGTTLLTYPMARGVHNGAMLWQALDWYRYRIPAGEADVQNAHRTILETAFDSCWTNPAESAPPSRYVAGSRDDLRLFQVQTIVVPFDHSRNPACATQFLTTVLGRPPAIEHGSAVWRLSG